ncbi:spermine oxidase-like isoform X2 [Ischnura elegans]|uniref:spermine oxidase-like isoform X2 n=1 Tax=Ischnura elegans TaxID=197161 RepID=UPI001ED891B3|nr:spermine oxidase-like isoform X2 [Ischnura elegans]
MGQGWRNLRFEEKLQDDSSKGINKNLARSFLEWYHKFENSIDASDSWFNTSGKGHIEYWECEGNMLLHWKNGGYASVIDLLTKKIPDPRNELPVLNRIQYNKEVNSIKWDGFSDSERMNKVSVTCADGSEYIADHIIITVSLGVLKENLNMFQPELPGKNSNAIKGLAFGTVDKIYLKYPHRWWPQDCAGFSLVWNEEDHAIFKKQLVNSGVKGENWLGDIFGFYSVDDHPLILCGWIVGPPAKEMEQASEKDLMESCNFLLSYFLGRHFNIPPCEEVKRSTWFSNKHFRGSYSYRSMDSEKMGTNAQHLSCPLTNQNGSVVVQFAGEATHPHYFSTVHGAVEAGWREADSLLRTIRHQISCAGTLGRAKAEEPEKCAVVIVGAGMAGLAAARALLSGGISDIRVLEAQDYAGGRVKSLSFGQSFIELGAQWIHGEDNEICKIAQESGLTSNVTSEEGEGLYLREDGSVVNVSLIKEVKEVVDRILDECESFAENHVNLSGIPSSVGEHLKQKFYNYLNLCRQSGESEEILSIKEELYDWHLRFQVIDNSCLRLENLSAKAWGNYEFCDGSDHVNFKSGYSTLIDKIVSDLPPGILQVNCPVKEVKWLPIIQASQEETLKKGSLSSIFCSTKIFSPPDLEGENAPVKITCENGRQLMAQHVIITCSLGYLKENHQKMFTPQLPKQIQDTISDMGFATIDKIFLDFGDPWWEPHIQGFQILWAKKTEALHSYSDEDWTRDISGFDVLHNHKGVLLGWVGSKGAEIVEKIPEDEVGRQCVLLLRKFTRNKDIPFPKRVIRSQWHSNPYVRGAYSHTTNICDASGSSPSSLSGPVYSEVSHDSSNQELKCHHPTLLFAGEAAHDCYFSTTHGAFESGKDQAMQIINLVQNPLYKGPIRMSYVPDKIAKQ